MACVLKHHRDITDNHGEIPGQLLLGLGAFAHALHAFHRDIISTSFATDNDPDPDPFRSMWPEIYEGWKSLVSVSLKDTSVSNLQLALFQLSLDPIDASCSLAEDLSLGMWRAGALRWGAPFERSSVRLALQLLLTYNQRQAFPKP
jgi:hypothetical protein